MTFTLSSSGLSSKKGILLAQGFLRSNLSLDDDKHANGINDIIPISAQLS